MRGEIFLNDEPTGFWWEDGLEVSDDMKSTRRVQYLVDADGNRLGKVGDFTLKLEADGWKAYPKDEQA
jgi:hypothetical protein